MLDLLVVSATVGAAAVLLWALGRWLNRAYTARWKCLAWLALAARLLLPFRLQLPAAVVRVPVPQREAAVWAPLGTLSPVEGPAAMAEEGTAAAAAGAPLTFYQAVFLLWVAGMVLFWLVQGVRYEAFCRSCLRWSRPASPQVAERAAAVAAQLGLSQPVPVLVSDRVAGPCTLGLWRPKLLLPPAAYEEEALLWVLRHELSHCRGRHLWYKLLLLLANGAHWFNPCVYLLCREAAADLERACDDRVTAGASLAERQAYGRVLLAAVEGRQAGGSRLTTRFGGSRRALQERFLNLLRPGGKRRGIAALVILCGMLIMVGSLIACHPDWYDGPPITPLVDPSGSGAEAPASSTDEGNSSSAGEGELLGLAPEGSSSQPSQPVDSSAPSPEEEATEVVSFAADFVDAFTGAVASGGEMDFEFYIPSKQNLVYYAQYMLTLTRMQVELGRSLVLFGPENSFGEAELQQLEDGLYYLRLPFEQQGYGATCQLLVRRKPLQAGYEILDFYFNYMDSIDTQATGHHTVRKVDDPALWDRDTEEHEKWFTEVLNRMDSLHSQLIDAYAEQR